MNEQDTELAKEAEAYADYNFKGEVNWSEAYESKLIELIRADEREACAAHYLTIMRKAIANEREACAKIVEADPSYDWHKFACEAAAVIRARGNT